MWAIAPYTEADLQEQIDKADDLYGAEGAQLQQDLSDYVAGINQYISEARTDPTKMPAEYAAIGKTLEDWQATDVIATASLVGGIFGKGGGDEVAERRSCSQAAKAASAAPPASRPGATSAARTTPRRRRPSRAATARSTTRRQRGTERRRAAGRGLARGSAEQRRRACSARQLGGLLGGLGLLERRLERAARLRRRSPSPGARWR